jgi:hypothetical protein
MFKTPSAADYWRSQKASSTLKVSSKRLCGPKAVLPGIGYFAAARSFEVFEG